MKKFKQCIWGLFFLVVAVVQAQVSVNVNIRTPPVWGPTVTTETYYYLPDIDSYYDIQQSQFIFLNNGVWLRSRALPRRYKSYNLNTAHVVVLGDYHGRNPYNNNKYHKTKYYKGPREVMHSRSDNRNHKSNKNSHKKGKD
ncbi:MAG: hypothetical protein ACRC6O_12455 [Flavobacterium sp.]